MLLGSSCLLAYSHDNHVTSPQEASRREAITKGAAAIGAAFIPAAANAAAGESPKFSIFGLAGDAGSMSEGAAYGVDQSTPLYSPYSVYGDYDPAKSLYKPDDPAYAARNKAVIKETGKRLAKLPSYIEKKKWFEVTDELSRYMYETRGAVKALAKTPEQKKAATAFFKSIEKADLAATKKNQDLAFAAAKDTLVKLDAFTKTL